MTRSEIREKAQVLLDEYSDQGGWEVPELDHHIDFAHNEVASLFLKMDDSYYLKTANISLVAGTELYNLPSDCLKIKRITDPDGVPISRLYKLTDRYEYIGYGDVKLYYLQGSQIGFLDIPSTAETFGCLYVHAPVAMTDDDDSPDVPEYLGHDLIAFETAVSALAQDEEINLTLNAKAKNLRTQIEEFYYTRNIDFPRQAPRDEALDDLDL